MKTSEQFVDKYGTTIIVRKQADHDHVQLLMKYADGSEDTSYGFTTKDFANFSRMVNRVRVKVERA